MTEATLSADGERRWVLSGVLDFSTVPAIWPTLDKLLEAGTELTLSLAGVGQANSAGLVLLLEARDQARQRGCRLHLLEIPTELQDLASVSGCAGLITQNAG